MSAAQATFVGRQAERERLAAALRDACAGQPQVVLVEGDAGIGKTRLAREVEAEAEALGMQAVLGRFIEDGQVPYLAFATAFVPQVERAGLLDERSPLGPLAAHLRRIAGLPSGEAREAHIDAGLHLAVARAALLLADRRPLLFVIDDLHWAETASVDLIAHLVRSLADASEREAARAMLLVLTRPPAPESGLERVLERLRREPIVSELRLSGLDELEVNELVSDYAGAACAPPLLGALQRATAGNPLFVLELVDHLDASGALTRDQGRLVSTVDPEVLPLPREVTRAIAERLTALPDALRQLLTVAALAADEFTPEELAVVTGLPVDEALILADQGVTARLLAATGTTYRFAHPVIRHVAQEQASVARRGRLHAEIAARLLAAYGDGDDHVMEVAGHLAFTRDRSQAAGAVFQRAGDVGFRRLSWAIAARFRDLALECPEFLETISPGEHAGLVLASAVAHYRDMDIDGAATRFDDAIGRYQAEGDLPGWGEALEGRLRIEVSHRPFGQEDRQVASAFRDFEAAAAGDHAAALRALPMWAEFLYRSQDPRMEETALRARELGSQQGDTVAILHATFTLGLAAGMRLDWGAAADHYREVGRLVEQLSDPWYGNWGLQNLPIALAGIGQPVEAYAASQRAAALARGLGDWAVVSSSEAWRVDIAAALGRFDESERAAGAARLALTRSGFSWSGPPLFSGLAWSRAQRGQRDGAYDAVQELEALIGGPALGSHLRCRGRRRGTTLTKVEISWSPRPSGDDGTPGRRIGGGRASTYRVRCNRSASRVRRNHHRAGAVEAREWPDDRCGV